MALPLPQLLKIMVDEGGSDLHITTNSPPLIRVHGILKRIEHPAMSPAETGTPSSARAISTSALSV